MTGLLIDFLIVLIEMHSKLNLSQLLFNCLQDNN